MAVLARLGTTTLAALAARTPRPHTRYPVEPLDLPVRHTPLAIVRANGIRIAYDAFGDPADPALLLVMGLGGQLVAWNAEFCEHLAARGFYVVRFDNRDTGRSTRMDDAGVPNLLRIRKGTALPAYSLSDMADDALGLLDAIDVASAHVVGVSMGGMIAQHMALRAPERVRTLASMMSTTNDPELPAAGMRTTAALMMPAPRQRNEYLKRTLLVWRILSGPEMPIDRARTLEMAGLTYDRGINPEGTARQLAAVIAEPARSEQLRSLGLPTVVIHGAADPLVPLAAGRATAAAIPDAELLVIPRMGHAFPAPVWRPIIDAIARNAARDQNSPIIPISVRNE